MINAWLDKSARTSPSILTAHLEEYIRAKYEYSDANTLDFLQSTVGKYNVALASVEIKARVSVSTAPASFSSWLRGIKMQCERFSQEILERRGKR